MINSGQCLGFTYTYECPPTFPKQLMQCYTKFKTSQLPVYDSILAVIRAPISRLHEWCHAYRYLIKFIYAENKCIVALITGNAFSLSLNWQHLNTVCLQNLQALRENSWKGVSSRCLRNIPYRTRLAEAGARLRVSLRRQKPRWRHSLKIKVVSHRHCRLWVALAVF